MKIKIYKYDERFAFINEMMINENLIFILDFNIPKSEIIDKIKEYEGCLYELFKNNKLIAEGVLSTYSLYDDLMGGQIIWN